MRIPALVLLLALMHAPAAPVDVLDLVHARAGPGVPPEWKVRAVRGSRAPESEIVSDAEGVRFRLHGAGRAAWFYRELPAEIAVSDGALRWSWRVLEAPADADLRVERLDDSPLRVFVVFGHPGLFRRSARTIFYTFGNAEPTGYEHAGASSDRIHVIRVDGAADRARWAEHRTNPFADFRRIWNAEPPAITAIGVMQDTDQTGAPATGEIRRLEWGASNPDGAPQH